jgi:hypothetical protein
MSRPLALLAAVLALAALPARGGEPLDLDLTRLGAPTAALWKASSWAPGDATAVRLAADSRVRFARLATDLALSFSSSLLQAASTTGAAGFDVAMETSSTPIRHAEVGAAADYQTGWSRDTWPTRSERPSSLLMPSVHVRKAFPYSLELGGRVTYLARSLLYATQLEAKWAALEGYGQLPDVALRAAYTRLAGQRDLRLSTIELDLLVSHRFGLNAVVSLTPYLAARYTLLSASTRTLLFGSDTPSATPAELTARSAAYPSLDSRLYRTTLGVRLTSFALSLAAEATYFGGASAGKSGAGEGDYPRYRVPASLATAFRLGFEF